MAITNVSMRYIPKFDLPDAHAPEDLPGGDLLKHEIVVSPKHHLGHGSKNWLSRFETLRSTQSRELATKDNAHHGIEFSLRMQSGLKTDKSKIQKKVVESSDTDDAVLELGESLEVFSSAYLKQMDLANFTEEFGGYFPDEEIQQLMQQLDAQHTFDAKAIEQFLANKCPTILQKYLTLSYVYQHGVSSGYDSSYLVGLRMMMNEIEIKKSGYLYRCFADIHQTIKKKARSRTENAKNAKLTEFVASCETFEVNLTPAQFVTALDAVGKLVDDDFERLSGIYAHYALIVYGRTREGLFSERNELEMCSTEFLRVLLIIQSLYHSSKELLLGFDAEFAGIQKTLLLRKFATLPDHLVTNNSIRAVYDMCRIPSPDKDKFILFINRLYQFFKNSAFFYLGIKAQTKDKFLLDLMSLRNIFDKDSGNPGGLNLVSYAREYFRYA